MLFLAAAGCSSRPEPMISVEAFRNALIAAGWEDVSYHPVDTASLEQAGIVEAGLLHHGAHRIEVYRVGESVQASEVAGFLSGAGDPVYRSGSLLAMVPEGRADAETVRMLTALGFQR